MYSVKLVQDQDQEKDQYQYQDVQNQVLELSDFGSYPGLTLSISRFYKFCSIIKHVLFAVLHSWRLEHYVGHLCQLVWT